jgi:cellulose biosynthesis protein BcsQ
MIDTDPQGTLTESVGLQQEAGFYDWIAKEQRFTDVVRPVPGAAYDPPTADYGSGRAYIVPSNWESANVPRAPVSPIIIRHRLAEAAEIMKFDLAIIDPPPSESDIHPWLVNAADYALLPTQCLAESFASLKRTMRYIKDHQPFREGLGLPATKIIGILPTMYEPRGVIVQEEFLAMLHEQYEMVWEPVAQRTAWQVSAAMQRAIFVQEPDGQAAREARLMWERVIVETGLMERETV